MTSNKLNKHRNMSISSKLSKRATTYKKPYNNNNKLFNYKQKSIRSGGSFL